MISIEAIQAYYENGQNNPLVLREKGLNKRLCPEEIAACLIHISNYRGYKEFYDLETEDLDDETASEKKGLDEVEKADGAGRLSDCGPAFPARSTFYQR